MVAIAGESIGVAGLAGVISALRHAVADAGIRAEVRRYLAEPAADEDGLKIVSVTRSEDLSLGPRGEFVDELTTRRVGSILERCSEADCSQSRPACP